MLPESDPIVRLLRFKTRDKKSISSLTKASGSRPDDEASQRYADGEVGGELVVTGGDAAPVLEPAEHALDQVAQLVGVRIERMVVLAGRIVGNDGSGAALDREQPAPVAAIGATAPGFYG